VKTRILFVSNGHGEDVIATNLIRAFRKSNPNLEIDALPLVGDGQKYKDISITPLTSTPELPSGGFVRNGLALLKDLKAGVLGHHFSHIRQIKSIAPKITLTVAVGDIFCLILSKLFNPTPTVFLPTAKSDHFMPHSGLEISIMRRLAKRIYPRDPLTANNLSKHGLSCQYLGNPILDNLNFTDETFGTNDGDFVMGLLPGSRNEAYPNMTKILDVIAKFNSHNLHPRYLVAIAGSIQLSKLKAVLEGTPWTLTNSKANSTLCHSRLGLKVTLTPLFADVLKVSNCLIGLAGTANEQAIYLNRPVFCFKGHGPPKQHQTLQGTRKAFGQQASFYPGKRNKCHHQL